MCLIISSIADFSFAKEDIICYKLVIHRDGRYETPCQHVEIPLSVMKGLTAFNAKGAGTINKAKDGTLYITKGYIHTHFKIYPGLNPIDRDAEIWKCIIPKGTAYWLGCDTPYHLTSLASKSIKFVKRIR